MRQCVLITASNTLMHPAAGAAITTAIDIDRTFTPDTTITTDTTIIAADIIVTGIIGKRCNAAPA